MKRIFKLFFVVHFLILFIFLLQLSSAYQLGVSPTKLEFKGDTNELICKNINFFSKDYIGKVNVYDKFENYKSKFDIIYKREFNLKLREDVELCIRGNDEGNYEGFLIFAAEDANMEVGTKIIVSIKGDNENINFISGNIVGENKVVEKIIITDLVITGILLIISLVLLIILMRNSNSTY